MMCIFKCCLQSQIIFSSKIWPVFSLCSSYSSVTMYYLKVEKKVFTLCKQIPTQMKKKPQYHKPSIDLYCSYSTVRTPSQLSDSRYYLHAKWGGCEQFALSVCLLAQLFKKFWFTWKSHKTWGLAQVRSDFWSPSECRNPESICCFSHHNFADKYI